MGFSPGCNVIRGASFQRLLYKLLFHRYLDFCTGMRAATVPKTSPARMIVFLNDNYPPKAFLFVMVDFQS